MRRRASRWLLPLEILLLAAAIVGLSGPYQSTSAEVHLPMTRRLDQVAVALRALEGHSHYRNTGSSLAAALGEAFHFVDSSAPGLQVVLLGDGELPTAEDYHEPVAALAQQGVAVHGITIGGVEGRARNILDFHDVVAAAHDRFYLTSERETIEQALERIASQAFEAGKYHRRTLPEQFPRSAWADPDPELWW